MAEDVVYYSARRIHPALEELRELINYRELYPAAGASRCAHTCDKRSVLGIAWTLLNPLGMLLVLTLAFSQILRFNTVYGYAAFGPEWVDSLELLLSEHYRRHDQPGLGRRAVKPHLYPACLLCPGSHRHRHGRISCWRSSRCWW